MPNPSHSIAAVVVFAFAASCGGSPHAGVEGAPGGRCGLASSTTAPLIVEWSSASRGHLEALRAKHVVAVRYTGCELELLPQCEVRGGHYGYVPLTPKRERVRVRNEDELYANIPLHAVSLAGKLRTAGELNVKMAVVGRFEAASTVVSKDDLQGDCDGATHVIAGLTAGAFSFFAGTEGEAGADVGVGSLRAGGSTKSHSEVLNEDGNAEACARATASDTAPPFGCGALMQVEVVALGAPRPPEPACPAHMRWTGASCESTGGAPPGTCPAGTVLAQGACIPGAGGCPAGTRFTREAGCVVDGPGPGPDLATRCPAGMHHEGEGCVPSDARPGAMARIPGAPMLYQNKHVEVATYDLDVTEVSLAAYKACVDARACSLPYFQDENGPVLGRLGYDDYASAKACHWADGKVDHPVNCVDWTQAEAYCKWAGKRLPTIVEFVYAAIGQTGWAYPWGNEVEDHDPRVCGTYERTCPVWSQPRGQSKFGVYHLADNVGEWLLDPDCSGEEPCKGDKHHVIGGEIAHARNWQVVGAALNTQRGPQNGFRCARTP